MLIIMFALPVFGFKQIYNIPQNNEGVVYGSVKGVMISSETINQIKTDGMGDREVSKEPIKVDVYYGKTGILTEDAMLEDAGIVIFPEDHVEFFPEPRLGLGSKITVFRAREVVVNDTGKVMTYRTWSKNLNQFLREKELDLGPHDIISPSSDDPIRRQMSINIRRADDSREIKRIILPFNVIVKDDPNLPAGKVKIRQQGEAGERQLIWQVIRRDGVEIKRTFLKDIVVRVPQDRLVMRGTKPVTFKGPYYDWIKEAADKYGADADAMYRIMMCESGGDPYAISPSGKYVGLYQYDELTWSASGWGDKDRTNAFAQINAAAKAWPSRYTKWPVSSRICGDLGK